MRFSISFLVVLTFWAALIVQGILAFRKARSYAEKQAVARAQCDAAVAQLRILQSKEMLRLSRETQRKLHDFDQLGEALTREFHSAIPPLEQVETKSDALSIRSLPILQVPRVLVHGVRVHVPESPAIELEASLVDDSHRQAQAASVQAFQDEIIGPNPLTLPLVAGTHDIHIEFDHSAEAEKPFLTVKIDDRELGRWVCRDSEINGWGTSHTSWRETRQYPAENGRLPEIIQISPGRLSKSLSVRLVVAKGETK